MATRAQLLAAPMEVKLLMPEEPGSNKKVKKTLYMSPMQDHDFAEYETWVRQTMVQVVKDNVEGLSQEDKDRQMDRVFDRVQQIGFMSVECDQLRQTIPGAVKMIWMCLRHRHPDITEEEVLQLWTDPENVEAAMDVFDILMRTHGPGAGGKKKPKSKVPRKKISTRVQQKSKPRKKRAKRSTKRS